MLTLFPSLGAGVKSGASKFRFARHSVACSVLVAVVAFAGIAFAARMQGMGKAAKQDSPQAVVLHDAKDVDAFMASLSDAQARTLLHGKLTTQVSQEKPGESGHGAGAFS